MALHVDPDRHEIIALRRAADWRGRHVIDLGCGDGRLTRRLARLGAIVRAVDPNAGGIRTARASLARSHAARVRYRVASAQRTGYASASFDLAVFTWSL